MVLKGVGLVFAAVLAGCAQTSDDDGHKGGSAHGIDAGDSGNDVASSTGGAGGQPGDAGGGGAAGDAASLKKLLDSPCTGLALDGEFLYAVTAGNGALVRVPLTGGTPAMMAPCCSGAVAAAAGTVVVGISGGISKFGPGGTQSTIVQGLQAPWALAIFGEDVYWTDFAAGAVQKVPLAGGAVTTIAKDLAGPTGLTVAAGRVFWTNRGDGTVMSAAVDGTDVTTLATLQKQPMAVATDGATVYWVNRGTPYVDVSPADGELVSAPIGGGVAKVLAPGLSLPSSIAADAAGAYWANWGSVVVSGLPKPTGMVMRLAPGSNAPDLIAGGQDGVTAVALSNDGIFWCTEGAASAFSADAGATGGLYSAPK